MGTFFAYIAPVILTIFVLLWWGKNCYNDEYGELSDAKFPTIGHGILLVAASCFPVFGIIVSLILTVVFIALRLTGQIHLKPNKFNKKFFNIDEDDV